MKTVPEEHFTEKVTIETKQPADLAPVEIQFDVPKETVTEEVHLPVTTKTEEITQEITTSVTEKQVTEISVDVTKERLTEEITVKPIEQADVEDLKTVEVDIKPQEAKPDVTLGETVEISLEVDKEAPLEVEPSEVHITFPKQEQPEQITQEQELVPEETREAPTEVTEQKPVEKELGEAPKFTKQLEDLTQTEGQPVRFEAKVSGIPKPDVHWYLDGEELTDAQIYDFINTEDGTCVLVIQETFPEDEGQYICKATNEYGSATSSAQLFLQGKCNYTTVSFHIVPYIFYLYVEF